MCAELVFWSYGFLEHHGYRFLTSWITSKVESWASWSWKLKAECSFGTPGINKPATQCNNPEDFNPQDQGCGNLNICKCKDFVFADIPYVCTPSGYLWFRIVDTHHRRGKSFISIWKKNTAENIWTSERKRIMENSTKRWIRSYN
jgi:hypothetical protein